MRLYLLPISTRRTLLYCQRLDATVAKEPSYLDKGTQRAAKLWAGWEEKESGWQKKVVVWGNKALKRIPFEEWGLKSLPPLSSRQEKDKGESDVKEVRQVKVDVSFPESVIPKENVLGVLKNLGTEREGLHRKRMIWCFVGMPISAPVALVPIIPNLPFFYLVYRAWSHWRALSGSKHIQHLLNKNLISPTPSPILDELYAAGIAKAISGASTTTTTKDTDTVEPSSATSTTQQSSSKTSSSPSTSPSLTPTPPSSAPQPSASASVAATDTPHKVAEGEAEVLLLQPGDSLRISKELAMPELHAELDRAIWQVQRALSAERELVEEKEELARTSRAQAEQLERVGHPPVKKKL